MKRHKFYFKKKILNICKKDNYIHNWHILRFLKNTEICNFYLRQYIITKLDCKYRLNNFNKLKIFCLITGKTQGVMKKFKLSRMSLIENLTKGSITGFFKN
jgi:ribosomal protein S14